MTETNTSEEVKEESKKEYSFMETVKEVFVLFITVLLWLIGAYVCGKLSITHRPSPNDDWGGGLQKPSVIEQRQIMTRQD